MKGFITETTRVFLSADDREDEVTMKFRVLENQGNHALPPITPLFSITSIYLASRAFSGFGSRHQRHGMELAGIGRQSFLCLSDWNMLTLRIADGDVCVCALRFGKLQLVPMPRKKEHAAQRSFPTRSNPKHNHQKPKTAASHLVSMTLPHLAHFPIR